MPNSLISWEASIYGGPSQGAALVTEAQQNTFTSPRGLKATTIFPGEKSMVIFKLMEVGLRA
jgi:hypothetical protein